MKDLYYSCFSYLFAFDQQLQQQFFQNQTQQPPLFTPNNLSPQLNQNTYNQPLPTGAYHRKINSDQTQFQINPLQVINAQNLGSNNLNISVVNNNNNQGISQQNHNTIDQQQFNQMIQQQYMQQQFMNIQYQQQQQLQQNRLQNQGLETNISPQISGFSPPLKSQRKNNQTLTENPLRRSITIVNQNPNDIFMQPQAEEALSDFEDPQGFFQYNLPIMTKQNSVYTQEFNNLSQPLLLQGNTPLSNNLVGNIQNYIIHSLKLQYKFIIIYKFYLLLQNANNTIVGGAPGRFSSFFKILDRPIQTVTQKVKPFVDQNKKRIKNMKVKIYKQFQREQDSQLQSDTDSQGFYKINIIQINCWENIKRTFYNFISIFKQGKQTLGKGNKNLQKKAKELTQKDKTQINEGKVGLLKKETIISSGSSGKGGLKKVASLQEMTYLNVPGGDGCGQVGIKESKSAENLFVLGRPQDNFDLKPENYKVQLNFYKKVNNLILIIINSKYQIILLNDDGNINKLNKSKTLWDKSVIEGEDGEDDMFAFDKNEDSQLLYKDQKPSNPNPKTQSNEIQLQRRNLYINDEPIINQKGLNDSYSQISMSMESSNEGEVDYTKELGDLNLKTIKYKRLKKKRCNPILPDSNFKTGWDLSGLFLILYEAILIPYRVSFNIPSTGWFAMFEVLIDLFFITDVCINMYTGYYKKGFLVMRRRHVMWRYLRTWFILDFVASFPYAWFISEAVNQDLEELEHEYA